MKTTTNYLITSPLNGIGITCAKGTNGVILNPHIINLWSQPFNLLSLTYTFLGFNHLLGLYVNHSPFPPLYVLQAQFMSYFTIKSMIRFYPVLIHTIFSLILRVYVASRLRDKYMNLKSQYLRKYKSAISKWLNLTHLWI